MTKPTLTVTLDAQSGTIKALGIVEDVTIFSDASFKSLTEAFNYLHRQYRARYRVVLNIDPSCNRFTI